MNAQTQALQLHADVLTDPDIAGEWVTFESGTSKVKLLAAMGKTDWNEATGGEGGDAYVGVSSTDFIVKRSDLVLGGKPIVPRRGQKVTRADGSIYRVIPGLNSVPAEPNDGREVLMRIHTVKAREADA